MSQWSDNAPESWMALVGKYEVYEENQKKLIELQTGGTHVGSRTQANILTYGSMNYIIQSWSSKKSGKIW